MSIPIYDSVGNFILTSVYYKCVMPVFKTETIKKLPSFINVVIRLSSLKILPIQWDITNPNYDCLMISIENLHFQKVFYKMEHKKTTSDFTKLT